MSRGPGSRMRKVNELLREVIAEEVGNLKDPRIGFVTITGVDTSPDLRTAIVYYSVLGSPEEQAATAAALDHARPHFQSVVGRQVRLKYTPRLTFRVDESIERGIRISSLLHELNADEQEEAP
jgi:ribosome-binding factor A